MRAFHRLLLATLLLLPAHAAAAQDDAFEPCREGRRRVSNLQAREVSCDKARWVARRFDEKVTSGGTWPEGEAVRVGRFRCRSRQTGSETYRIRCRRGESKRVRFDWGV